MKKETLAPTQFELDCDKPLWIHNSQSNRAYYNLIVTIRDMSGWVELGMKPNRHWRFKDVKKYFGLEGYNKHQVLQILKDCRDQNKK